MLTGDQLVSLVAPRARFEQHFPSLNAYFFTIDGVLNGTKIVGAMFGDSCMLVYASSKDKAMEQANAGVRTTITLLHDEYNSRNSREFRNEVMSAGRRGNIPFIPTAKSLEQRDLVQRMIADAMQSVKPTNE